MQHRPKHFKMPHWPIPRGNRDINLGLERMQVLMEKLGNPHKKLPPIIHVAGTNGKGSTLAYLQAMFESAGYKVHKYISPHLVNFNERITLAGDLISSEMVDQLAEECRYVSENEDIPISFFEGITAMAFLAFSRVPADVLLLEVGMGGRLDATNIIDDVICSIITSISFDHMEHLGNSITAIATEKAAIIKPNSFCVFSWQVSEAMKILIDKADEVDAERYACGYDWNFIRNQDDSFDIIVADQRFNFPKPSLVGIHQYINASTAAMAALRLNEVFPTLSFDHICNGLKAATWAARMQQITVGVLSSVLPQNFELWLDGAHNDAGAQMVITSLQTMKPAAVIYAIHGRTIHRDMRVFLEHFIGVVELISCIEIMGEPDSEDPHKIKDTCDSLGIQAIVSETIKDSVLDIIKYHQNKYGNKSLARIIICGSLFLAGDVLLANKM
jgi:dihydrofolate synthase/folylpolyglutamate synthase